MARLPQKTIIYIAAVNLGSDFATRLENTVKRSDAAKLIEAQSIGTSSISD
jgi:hypothetical protein